MEKQIKKYRFIGNPKDYNEGDKSGGYKIGKNHILKENTIPSGWSTSVAWHVERLPEDWELIEELEDKVLEAAKDLVKACNDFKEKDFPSLSNDLADKFLNQRIELIKKSLGIKAKEYVRNEDRMWNFNQAAIKSGKTREEALAGFRLKHEVSIDDMREDIKKGKLPTKELVLEKFGDVINYYILEEMSILHRLENE